MTHPKVSIVTATWNRGKHLVPTLKSALQQDFQDFEIIVVGDGCTDDTEQVLQPYLSDRLRWINLPHNTGSQAFPNNAGIAAARGEYIAYLGHDDIWDKSHLNHLNVALHGNGAADFCVSGCISYGPLDSNFYRVTGFFERPDDPFVHFVPPSAIMHRRSAVKTSGMWRSPHRVRR